MPKSCSMPARAPRSIADHEERAIYVAEGEVDIAGDKFEAPQLLVFRPGDRITVTATRPARLMFLGGAALEGPRYIWWNFVSSRQERIEQAKEEWKTGRFAPVPGDDRVHPAAGELGPILRAESASRKSGDRFSVRTRDEQELRADDDSKISHPALERHSFRRCGRIGSIGRRPRRLIPCHPQGPCRSWD